MPTKRCPTCGRFMALSDTMPLWDEDEFDMALAVECGFDIDTDDKLDEQWIRFSYVLDQWYCKSCVRLEPHTSGKRYYFNPDSGWYDGEKPLTPKEQIVLENQRQEAAGQLRLFD